MALLDFQNLLVNLYTHEGLREEFLSDKEIFLNLRATNLSTREREAILGIDGPLLKSFSHALWHKKNKIIQRILKRRPLLVVAASWYKSSPAIIFKNSAGDKIIDITEKEFFITKNMKNEIN